MVHIGHGHGQHWTLSIESTWGIHNTQLVYMQCKTMNKVKTVCYLHNLLLKVIFSSTDIDQLPIWEIIPYGKSFKISNFS